MPQCLHTHVCPLAPSTSQPPLLQLPPSSLQIHFQFRYHDRGTLKCTMVKRSSRGSPANLVKIAFLSKYPPARPGPGPHNVRCESHSGSSSVHCGQIHVMTNHRRVAISYWTDHPVGHISIWFIQSPSTLVDGSWLQLKLKRRRLQRRLHAHLTLLHVYYPWNQIKSILLLNIRITKQTNPDPSIRNGRKEDSHHHAEGGGELQPEPEP